MASHFEKVLADMQGGTEPFSIGQTMSNINKVDDAIGRVIIKRRKDSRIDNKVMDLPTDGMSPGHLFPTNLFTMADSVAGAVLQGHGRPFAVQGSTIPLVQVLADQLGVACDIIAFLPREKEPGGSGVDEDQVVVGQVKDQNAVRGEVEEGLEELEAAGLMAAGAHTRLSCASFGPF